MPSVGYGIFIIMMSFKAAGHYIKKTTISVILLALCACKDERQVIRDRVGHANNSLRETVTALHYELERRGGWSDLTEQELLSIAKKEIRSKDRVYDVFNPGDEDVCFSFTRSTDAFGGTRKYTKCLSRSPLTIKVHPDYIAIISLGPDQDLDFTAAAISTDDHKMHLDMDIIYSPINGLRSDGDLIKIIPKAPYEGQETVFAMSIESGDP